MSNESYVNICDRCGKHEPFRVHFDYYLCEPCMITLTEKQASR